MKKILVTGSDSGLGKFLKKKFSAKGFNRKSNFSKIQNVKWNLIIHCAFNPKEPYDKNSLTKLINDNLVLSYNVSKLKGIKIFISSCSVYENLPIKKRTENSKIFINKKNSFYSKFKILSESFFKDDKNTIIRLGSIIGKDMRNNTIKKILFDKDPSLFLNKNSLYSFITYEEIFDFIKICQTKKLKGTYNLLRADYKNLDEIVSKVFKNKNIKYGKKTFKVIKASNKKLKKYLKISKSSTTVIKEFYDNYK
tara:strand:- start:597 stop:1352 length:756 start_codon:yes stop_codon:yes gene_type:complete